MKRFHVIDDAHVILRSRRGVYRQAKVYRFGNNELFAGSGGGFVRLYRSGGTSAPDISWSDLSVPFLADALGRLMEGSL